MRAEETTPSNAGGSARMDFVVKTHGIVIELKMASLRLTDKKLGEQLAVDIQRYGPIPIVGLCTSWCMILCTQ